MGSKSLIAQQADILPDQVAEINETNSESLIDGVLEPVVTGYGEGFIASIIISSTKRHRRNSFGVLGNIATFIDIPA